MLRLEGSKWFKSERDQDLNETKRYSNYKNYKTLTDPIYRFQKKLNLRFHEVD